MITLEKSFERRAWVGSLAYAGLIPFAGLAVLSVMGSVRGTELFQLYGLSITCFLLGSWWGIGLSAAGSVSAPLPELFWSNGLVLTAVSVYAFFPAALAIALQGILFGMILLIENRLGRLRRAPTYYRRLRGQVTAVTCLIHGWVVLVIGGAVGAIKSASINL